jgi:hypothetical protein
VAQNIPLKHEVNELERPAPLSWELFESAGIAVTDRPQVVIEPSVAEVCSCKPSIIDRGKAALERLKNSRDFGDWVDLINALAEVQTAAMQEAGTNAPQGPKYRKAIAKKLRLYGFDRIHKTTRSFLLKQVNPNLEDMIAWRAKQLPEVQLELNHPRVVLSRWKRSLKKPKPTPEPESNPKSKPDLLIAWQSATDSELTAALNAIPLLDFLRVMPMAWRTALMARSVRLHDEQSGKPDPRISEILQTALSHVEVADQSKTGKPVAQGHEISALNELRMLLQVLSGIDRDPHDVGIVLKPRQTGQTKRRSKVIDLVATPIT